MRALLLLVLALSPYHQHLVLCGASSLTLAASFVASQVCCDGSRVVSKWRSPSSPPLYPYLYHLPIRDGGAGSHRRVGVGPCNDCILRRVGDASLWSSSSSMSSSSTALSMGLRSFLRRRLLPKSNPFRNRRRGGVEEGTENDIVHDEHDHHQNNIKNPPHVAPVAMRRRPRRKVDGVGRGGGGGRIIDDSSDRGRRRGGQTPVANDDLAREAAAPKPGGGTTVARAGMTAEEKEAFLARALAPPRTVAPAMSVASERRSRRLEESAKREFVDRITSPDRFRSYQSVAGTTQGAIDGDGDGEDAEASIGRSRDAVTLAKAKRSLYEQQLMLQSMPAAKRRQEEQRARAAGVARLREERERRRRLEVARDAYWKSKLEEEERVRRDGEDAGC